MGVWSTRCFKGSDQNIPGVTPCHYSERQRGGFAISNVSLLIRGIRPLCPERCSTSVPTRKTLQFCKRQASTPCLWPTIIRSILASAPSRKCSTCSIAQASVEAVPVEVQVQISSGTPALLLVGLPDKAVGEARERGHPRIRARAVAGVRIRPEYDDRASLVEARTRTVPTRLGGFEATCRRSTGQPPHLNTAVDLDFCQPDPIPRPQHRWPD